MNIINQVLHILMWAGLIWALLGGLIRLFNRSIYRPWFAWGGLTLTGVAWLLMNANIQTVGIMMLLASLAVATSLPKEGRAIKVLSTLLFVGGLIAILIGLGIQMYRYKSEIRVQNLQPAFAGFSLQEECLPENSDGVCDKSIFDYPLVQALLILILVILITELFGNPFEFLLPKEGSQEK